MKTGYRTTEFWATVLLNIGVLATALTNSLPPKWACIFSTISVGAYTAARTLTKATTGPGAPAPVVIPSTAAVALIPPPRLIS
jgi:hypothetical protein